MGEGQATAGSLHLMGPGLEKLCGLCHLSAPTPSMNYPILQKTRIWYTLRVAGMPPALFSPKKTFLINRFYLPQPSSLMFTQLPLRTF